MCRPSKRPKPVAVGPVDAAQSAEIQIQQLSMMKREDVASQQESFGEYMQLPDNLHADARPKTFVYTAFDMVSDLANAQAVGFTDDGTALEVRDVVYFSEHVLPKYFRHKNVTSFYRQLNSHGFRTTRSVSCSAAHTFVHEQFKRDRPELLSTIVRKKCIPKEKNPKEASKSANTSEPVVITPAPAFEIPSVGLVLEPQPLLVCKELDAVAPPRVTSESGGSLDEVMQMIDELRESKRRAQEREFLLEERNRKLEEDNRSILKESEIICHTMRKLVESQTHDIGRLFGPEASYMFAHQVRQMSPMEYLVMPQPKPVQQKQHTQQQSCFTPLENHNSSESESEESPDEFFEDKDLQMLEDLLT
jgi:hypothetical protein